MADTSEWFEARSTDDDAARIRSRLDRLLEKIIGAAVRRHGKDDVLGMIRTVPDPDNPEEPVNSL